MRRVHSSGFFHCGPLAADLDFAFHLLPFEHCFLPEVQCNPMEDPLPWRRICSLEILLLICRFSKSGLISMLSW